MNVLALKLTSLANDAILFENSLISIRCKTMKWINDHKLEVLFVLTFIPKVSNLLFSSSFQATSCISAEPISFSEQLLISPKTQKIRLQFGMLVKIVDFPILKINLKSKKETIQAGIYLPFAISKYFAENHNQMETRKLIANVN